MQITLLLTGVIDTFIVDLYQCGEWKIMSNSLNCLPNMKTVTNHAFFVDWKVIGVCVDVETKLSIRIRVSI